MFTTGDQISILTATWLHSLIIQLFKKAPGQIPMKSKLKAMTVHLTFNEKRNNKVIKIIKGSFHYDTFHGHLSLSFRAGPRWPVIGIARDSIFQTTE